MRRRAMCIILIALLGASLLLGACSQGSDTGQVGPNEPFGPQGTIGPKGTIGPQGSLGPQGQVGPSSENGILIKDTGVLVESEYRLSGFSEIQVSDLFEAEIRQGESYRVVVKTDETLTPYLDVVVRGKTLHVGLKSNYTYNIEESSHRVEVTLPVLTRARISDFGTMDLKGLKADDSLKLEVRDFGELNGAIDAEDVQVEVSSHSELNLTGSASRVVGELTDMSSADLTGLKAGELDIDTDTHSTLDH